MSIEAMVAVRDLHKQHPEFDPRKRFVLYALANYADANGVCWPSYRTLEEWTGYTRRSIIRTINELRELGMIRTQPRMRENGSASSNIIQLAFMKVGCQADTGVVTHRHQGGDTVTPPELSLELPIEQQSNTLVEREAEPRPARKSATPTNQQEVEAIIQAWNDNRGTLPAVTVLSEARKRRLRSLIKEHNGQATALIRDATRQVANNSYWQENRYTLDNLLAGGKYLQHAEAYRHTNERPKYQPVEVPF